MDSLSLLHKLQVPDQLGLDPVSTVLFRKIVLDAVAAAPVNAVPLAAAPSLLPYSAAAAVRFDCEGGKSPSSVASQAESTEPYEFLDQESARLQPYRAAKEIRPTSVTVENYHQFLAVLRLQLIDELSSLSNFEIALPGRPKMVKAGYGNKNFRGSRFRGVSKNKQKWQILISVGPHKQYTGGLMTEEKAARLYDRKAISTFGLRAKTNFPYSKGEVLSILQEEEPATI